VVGTAAALFVQTVEILEIQAVNNGVDQAHRIVFRNIPVDSLRKKHRLVVYVRTKVYLCRHFFIYLIVTKLLKLFDMTKPPLEKVEAYLYVLQHVTQELKKHKEGVPEF
jgi:hypothetical protein